MITDKDYLFEVSLSKMSYKSKEETKAAIKDGSEGRQQRKECGIEEKISFIRKSTTSQELLENCLEGYTFCHLFEGFPDNDMTHSYLKKDGHFTLSGKSSNYFVGSYVIGIDIDETKYRSPGDYIHQLSLQPTFWYTSLSNMQIDVETGEFKGARFRLIYVFDQLIPDKYYFRYCSWNLHKKIESDTGETIKDSCGLICTQYFNGTNRNNTTLSVDYGLTNDVYSLSDINISNNGYLDFLNNNCYYKSVNTEQKEEIEERIRILLSQSNIIKQQQTSQVISACDKSIQMQKEIELDYTMINNASRLSWDDYYQLYKNRYQFVYRVETDNWEYIGDIKFQYCEEDYIELAWIPKVITDGHHRRNVLFHRAWLRRLIKPSITPDELFYNLMVDRQRFFDNKDNVLSVDLLASKVKESFRYSTEELIERYKDVYEKTKLRSSKKRIIIHRNSKGKVRANSIIKELRWRILDEAYNRDLSVLENLQILNDSDFIICRETIYRYLKDRNITCTQKSEHNFELFKAYHKPNLTIREEKDYLESKGLHLCLRTISNYRKKLAEGDT